ncbi:hypothetical protein [Streptomyces sp. AC512_CC834]|uniref:hypothetical protein n=1 Tax=Streptomyces sp. AC512_CC834 TaxID=2823691 RepID=UPI0020B67C1B|nr:hypothetical protein [Streptomyces sp. AC512_CC834]
MLLAVAVQGREERRRLEGGVAASWLLTSGFVLMAIDCLLCSRLDVTDPSLGAFVAPALLIGVGFALTVSSVTAVGLNSVPQQLAGMASATTNMLRDLGFALGPVAVNGLPPGAPGSAAHGLALDALGSGFGTAFLVCAVAAAVVGRNHLPSRASHAAGHRSRRPVPSAHLSSCRPKPSAPAARHPLT